MDLRSTDTQALIARTAAEFASRVLTPAAAETDETTRFPAAAIRELAALGLMAVNVDAQLGGAEAGVVAYALAMQEIARGCASTAVTMAVTNMVTEVIATFGTPAQRNRHCPKLATGEYTAGAFALSEPGAGSDPGSIATTAVRVDDGWLLSGSKQWVTSGAYAGVIVVWARTGDRSTHPGTRGLSCFLIEQGHPGLRIGRAEDKLGLRGSTTVSLHLDRCVVPADALLGELHGGFSIAMMALDGGRIGISAQAIGIARAALDASVRYVTERKQFGQPIASFQAVQWKLADMKTRLDAAHLLCIRAAWLKEHKKSFTREASMAKLFASEAAVFICNEAVQVHGGYGYSREFAVERHLRDARVTTIYEGTSEIQRTVITRQMLPTKGTARR